MNPAHYSGTVLHGDKTGRTLGFPTVNFDPNIFPENTVPGVYATSVTVHNAVWPGVLYYGPRITLGESKNVLEIHIIGYSGNLYGKELSFTVGTFIREPQGFSSTDELIQQLHQDCDTAKRYYQSSFAQ